MGNKCCMNSDEIYFNSNISDLKTTLIEEYKLYLLFLKQVKLNLNSSIEKNQNDNNDDNNDNSNSIINKKFYYVPRNWFENWEKRIETIYKTNKYKSFDYNFEFKNEDKLPKFYYEIISDEFWIQIYRNQMYKLNSKTRNFKNCIICNNIIIFQYTSNKSNNVELFFFEKEEDLFFTNLLFSFDKCENGQTECYNLLNLLQKSPIQEILGNIKYDKSEEFTVKSNKMVIYNKTGKIDEEIKKFRESLYDLEFVNKVHGPDSFQDEPKIYENRRIGDYFDNNKNKNIKYGGLIKIKQKNGENTINGYDISGVDSGRYLLNNTLNRNISNTLRVFKKNNRNDNDKTKTFILSLKNNSLISSKLDEKDYNNKSRNIKLKEEDNSSNNEYKLKSINIFDCFEENKNNQSFFESILYCLFNIKELTNYFLNNKEINKNSTNSFLNEYLKILLFLNDKKELIDKLNKNKINNIYEIIDNDDTNEYKLIRSCPNYNYQKLLRFIIYQNSINIISKIINTLHLDLNKSKNNEMNLIQNESNDETIYQDEEEEKNKKYEKFLKECHENNNSFIFDMFYGVNEIKVICNKCNKSHYKYEIVNLIEFSINKLAKYKKEKNSNAHNNINIIDCLNHFSEEKKQNDNLVIECHYCNEYQNYSIINKICKYPKIFIICLYYDNYSKNENDINIDFEEKIKIMDDEYRLIGIISWQKTENTNFEDDKYFAYCYSNKKWIFYDEKKINDFDFNINKKEIIPLVLFYKAKNNC